MKKFMSVPVLLLAVILVLLGCIDPEPDKAADNRTLTMMTWNVNNLFDGKDDGNEYPEFLQMAGWSAEKYIGRINNISDAIGKIEPQPDIFLLQEVESLQILKDLALSMRGEYWSHFAGNSGSAIGLGILSRLPLLDAKAHSITIGSDTIPRPVLETRVQTEEGDIIIFVCHWKSKLGGADNTESIRKASARVILRRIREILENEPQTGIIVAGDLNLNHDDFYKRDASQIYALLPDVPQAARMAGNEQIDFFVISGRKPPQPVYFPQETIVLYSPWMGELENGTYYYRNNWETIDHFLVSNRFFIGQGWQYEKTIIIDYEPFTRVSGLPNSYNPRTGHGLSDHLPLLMTLKIND